MNAIIHTVRHNSCWFLSVNWSRASKMLQYRSLTHLPQNVPEIQWVKIFDRLDISAIYIKGKHMHSQCYRMSRVHTIRFSGKSKARYWTILFWYKTIPYVQPFLNVYHPTTIFKPGLAHTRVGIHCTRVPYTAQQLLSIPLWCCTFL